MPASASPSGQRRQRCIDHPREPGHKSIAVRPHVEVRDEGDHGVVDLGLRDVGVENDPRRRGATSSALRRTRPLARAYGEIWTPETITPTLSTVVLLVVAHTLVRVCELVRDPDTVSTKFVSTVSLTVPA